MNPWGENYEEMGGSPFGDNYFTMVRLQIAGLVVWDVTFSTDFVQLTILGRWFSLAR